MMAYAYEQGLPAALDRGLATIAAIDAAVARVLDLKDQLGLFEDPFRRALRTQPAAPGIAERRAAARQAAARSMVLLQNSDGILPLPKSPGAIALIGPLGDAAREMIGPWSAAGQGEESASVLAGLHAALPDARIDPVEGVKIDGGGAEGIGAAIAAAKAADHVILCLGEAAPMSGEAASRARIDLPGRQQELADAVLALGKPVIVLLFSGRPIAMSEVFAKAAAVVACWFPGSEAGHAVADLLTGQINPSGRLSITWPRHVGQVPIAYSVRSGGRPENPADKYTSKYLDIPNSPQFAFGHGLSYAAFSLTDPKATVGEQIVIETIATNEGERAGTMPVFLFIRDPVASVARPVLELKRFLRVTLEAGEWRALTFTLDRADLAFLGQDLKPVVEAGAFEVHVGFSAEASQLRQTRFDLA